MTTSISSRVLLNYKKDTWIIKFEKKEKPKVNNNSNSTKKSKPFEHIFKVLNLCLL